MSGGNERIAVRNREDNGQKIFVPVGFCRSPEDLLGTDVVVRSREVDDKVLREKVVLVEWYEDVGKRCGRVTDVGGSVKQLDDFMLRST